MARRRQGLPLMVPAIGVTRRVRALVAVGWSLSDIQNTTGLSNGRLSEIASGRPVQVSIRTAQAVHRMFDEHKYTPRPGKKGDRARAFATARGWVTVLAWDDIDTDPEPETVAA